jgi:hypothetical protein
MNRLKTYSRMSRIIADRAALWAIIMFAAVILTRSAAALTINLTFDSDQSYINAGVGAGDVAAMKAACNYAAKQFTDRYSDPINVNIKVTASPGTSDLGSSTTFFDPVNSYNTLRNAFVADAKTADDATTVGAGGSLKSGTDPIATNHQYFVTRAQAKALGLRADDTKLDGTFNFGGGQQWTYDPNNRVVAGKFDFIGVAMHEYSEIMGRNSIMGDKQFDPTTPSYVAFDLFHYTGAGTRGLNNGPGRSFSIDNGTTLLIAFNDFTANKGDLQDWAGPAPDSFNAAGPPGEQDDLTPVDLRTMDVLGYDLIGTTLANISTRLLVQTGDNALFGGFIITGTQAKKVIVRAIGPSLTVAGKLADPTLELYAGNTLLEKNDNWVDSPNKQAILDSGIAPTNSLESAIVRTLPANGATYTAIVRGVDNNTTGIGVVEAYDLDRTVDSKLANISTRGIVQADPNALIAGTIVLGGNPQKVLVRALGPSLSVPGKLADPTLELKDANGTTLRANDNWRTGGQEADIIATTIPPTNDLESAIVQTLPAAGASYTAIVRSADNSTGIGVVEVYALN